MSCDILKVKLMKRFLQSIIVCLLLLNVVAVSWADQLILKNGDIITGDIQRIWDNEIIIEPEYDDDTVITISLALVDFIESDRKFKLTFFDDREVEALLSGSGTDDKQVVEIGEDVITMDLSEIFELDEIDDYLDWKSHLDINAALNRGNTDSTNVKLFADTFLKLGDHRHLASLTFDREEQNGVSTKEQDLLSYNYNWLYAGQWFVGLKASFEQDPIKNLDGRYIMGLTLGRDLWNRPRLFLNAQAGVGYLLEKDTFGATNESSVGLWALKYRQNFFSKDFEVYHDDSATIYLSGRSNNIIKTLTGIRYKITDLLYLNTSIGYDFETNPAEGAENYDMAFLFGFGLEY